MSISSVTEQKMSSARQSAGTRRRALLVVLYLIGIALFAALLIDGSSYYSSPYADRPHHEDYRSLRPAGSLGLLYGIIGSGMMVLMLVYTLRKRTRLFGRRMPLRPFLDFHIYMGVFGPLLILLHTSFKVQGLVSVAFWSMVAVALSGYFGRYLYQQIPRNIEDRELNLGEIDQLVTRLGDDMRGAGRLNETALSEMSLTLDAAYAVRSRGAFGALIAMIVNDLRRPWIDARLRRQLKRQLNLRSGEFEHLFILARRRALLKRRVAVLGRVQRLFHYWHVIHKPFAIIMYIIMGVHIGVAIWTGYGWF